MEETNIKSAVIVDLIKKYPNDMELGKRIREYYFAFNPKEDKNNG
jgi:hypothetical protein